MVTGETTRTRSSLGTLLVVGFIVGWLVSAALRVANDEMSRMFSTTDVPQHALDRHGADAIRAHEATAIEKLGKGGQFDCPDGKQYLVAPLPGWVEWAVRVLYDGVIKTEFVTTDRNYLARVIEQDKCTKEWQGGHP